MTDSAGNTYQLAAPVTRGAGVSQAIYYAKNIAGRRQHGDGHVRPRRRRTSTSASPSTAASTRRTPFDATASAAGTAATATSGNATTTAPRTLLFGAGMTTGGFTAAGAGFTTRIITQPDLDILDDRSVDGGRHLQRHGRASAGPG